MNDLQGIVASHIMTIKQFKNIFTIKVLLLRLLFRDGRPKFAGEEMLPNVRNARALEVVRIRGEARSRS